MATKCPKCDLDNPSNSKFCKECGTKLIPSESASDVTKTLETPAQELTKGTVFASRYEIIEKLGKGGMGTVYKALDKELREEVALKLIKPEIADDKRTIERFKNELKLARKIGHRNVGRMYELMEEEGKPFITMEYVEGEDLKSYERKEERLSTDDAISIAKQVCEGLVEAHELGVIHRDLKPQNIMIDDKGRAKIMDFGIARSVEAAGLTQTGVMIGTPDYISPEQAEGEEADHRSDIYSLGVILYEMVTGGVPFKGDTALSVALKHKAQLPQDPKKINPDISDDMSRLILVCMEKERERRYQSAEALLSDLKNLEGGLPLGTKIRPRQETFIQTIIQKKIFIPSLIVIALIIAIVIIWFPFKSKETVLIPSDKPSVAIMYFKNNTGEENLDFWKSALSDSIITDLSQSRYIRVLNAADLYSILRELNLLEEETYASEDLNKVAVKGEVNHILQGGLSKAGETFRIDYTLREMNTGKTISSDRVEGTGEESIFSMVDALTKKIKASMELSKEQIASDIDKDMRNITSSSPKALKYYSEGLKYRWKGEYTKSIPFFEKAITLDPEFAMAYRYLAYDVPEKRKMYMQKALELSDRISDRDRYQIQGDYYALSEKTYEQAIDAYENLLQLYPDDLRGSVSLGNIYSELERWDKAVELYEVGIQNKVESFVPYVNQANNHAALGLYDKSIELLKNYLNSFSDNKYIHYYLYSIYLIQRRYSLAISEIEKALSLDPAYYGNIRMKGDVYLCKGDLTGAEVEYQKLLDLDEQAAHLSSRNRLTWLYLLQGKFNKSMDQIKQRIELAEEAGEKRWEYSCHLDLAYLNIQRGNAERALEEYNKATQIAVETGSIRNQIKSMYFKGLTFLELGSIDEAHRAANELKKVIKGWFNEKLIRYYHNLMGMIDLKRENFPRAIENYNKAISLLPYQKDVLLDHALFIDHLAFGYYKSENLERAQEEYERITYLTIGRYKYGDIYAKSFYMLGRIYEKKGWKGKAIEHYEKFLDLWRNADPGIAEVEDAKKRLAGLKNQ